MAGVRGVALVLLGPLRTLVGRPLGLAPRLAGPLALPAILPALVALTGSLSLERGPALLVCVRFLAALVRRFWCAVRILALRLFRAFLGPIGRFLGLGRLLFVPVARRRLISLREELPRLGVPGL